MAVSCVYIYYSFQFSEIIFSFRCTTHNKTKIFGNLKTLLESPQEWGLPKTSVFLHISANLWGFCYLFWNTCIFSCFWKWEMGFADQQNSWPVPLRNIFQSIWKFTLSCGTLFSKFFHEGVWIWNGVAHLIVMYREWVTVTPHWIVYKYWLLMREWP